MQKKIQLQRIWRQMWKMQTFKQLGRQKIKESLNYIKQCSQQLQILFKIKHLSLLKFDQFIGSIVMFFVEKVVYDIRIKQNIVYIKQNIKEIKYLTMEADHINFGKLATHTALAFTVEQDNHQIQQLRQKYDPAFQRWQPHINICFPFVDKPFFDHVFNLLQEQFKQFPSFEVKFKSMDYFPHGTVFLVPQTDSNQFCLIQQKIVNVFPQLKGNKQFHPHMTVGKFNKGEVAKRKDELGSVWKEWTVKVDGISIIERGKDTPFKTFRKIKFAQNKKQ